MSDSITFRYKISGDDFTRAGEASSDVKNKLKMMGVDNNVIRKVAIAMYEGEINMVIHADGGNVTVDITDDNIKIVLADQGPGIQDVEKAMEAGFSTAPEEVRALGFGAGMGLPNMKKYSDKMDIQTVLGVGTTVTMNIHM
ncbi:MAG: ATP-binding protein [Eubacteriales bacterium]|nr:ATP-binding protein [Eubacteriales bacterium]